MGMCWRLRKYRDSTWERTYALLQTLCRLPLAKELKLVWTVSIIFPSLSASEQRAESETVISLITPTPYSLIKCKFPKNNFPTIINRINFTHKRQQQQQALSESKQKTFLKQFLPAPKVNSSRVVANCCDVSLAVISDMPPFGSRKQRGVKKRGASVNILLIFDSVFYGDIEVDARVSLSRERAKRKS
jgi:hypothetical protein